MDIFIKVYDTLIPSPLKLVFEQLTVHVSDFDNKLTMNPFFFISSTYITLFFTGFMGLMYSHCPYLPLLWPVYMEKVPSQM